MPRSAKKPRGQTPAPVADHNTGIPSAPTGLPYGEHQALVRSEQAAPIASGPPTGPAPGSAPAPGGPVGAPSPTDVHPAIAALQGAQHAGLMSPSARPDEPVTAGLASGPGPGPEVLGAAATPDPVQQLRALYAVSPNPDLLDLITHLGT